MLMNAGQAIHSEKSESAMLTDENEKPCTVPDAPPGTLGGAAHVGTAPRRNPTVPDEPLGHWGEAISCGLAMIVFMEIICALVLGIVAGFRSFVLDVPALPDSVTFYIVLHVLVPFPFGVLGVVAGWCGTPAGKRKWAQKVLSIYEDEISHCMGQGFTREQASFLIKRTHRHLHLSASRAMTVSSEYGENAAESKKTRAGDQRADAGRLEKSPDDALEWMIRAAEADAGTAETPESPAEIRQAEGSSDVEVANEVAETAEEHDNRVASDEYFAAVAAYCARGCTVPQAKMKVDEWYAAGFTAAQTKMLASQFQR